MKSQNLPVEGREDVESTCDRWIRLFQEDFASFRSQLVHTLSLKTMSLFVRLGPEGWEVLMGTKKRGLGVGNIIFPGGKRHTWETMDEAQVREACEEAGLQPTEYEVVGVLDVYSEFDPATINNQRVVISRVTRWVPVEGWQESDELGPLIWVPASRLPYGAMWPNERLYMESLIEGNKLHISAIVLPPDAHCPRYSCVAYNSGALR